MDKVRPKLKLKRQQVRRRRHQSAWITLDDGTTKYKCEVEDVSQSGAKITVDAAVQVGTLLGIALVPRATARRCEVIWRRGNTLGIRFMG
jgi:PilZ domain